jgi:hypothetical protein
VSRIGAKKQRQKSMGEWVLTRSPSSLQDPVPLPAEEWNYDEQQVKIACELSLFFMLLHMKDRMGWYRVCVDMAWSFPSGSYRDVFWWAMRFLPDDNYDLSKFRDYFEWKFGLYERGELRRDAGRW